MGTKIEDKENFRVQEFPAESGKVIFIFTGMAMRISQCRLFVKLMNKRGYTCIVYDYPFDLLFNVNLERWEQFYVEIIGDAQKRIQHYKDEGAKYFYAYGMSMGTLIANKLTRDTTEIKHVVLNLTFGDVASNIWAYKGANKTRQSLLSQGIDVDGLRAGIKYVDPILNAAKLKGKKVLLYLAKRDKLMRYEHSKYTYEALKEAGVEVEYVENKILGHHGALIKNWFDLKRLDKFYSS